MRNRSLSPRPDAAQPAAAQAGPRPQASSGGTTHSATAKKSRFPKRAPKIVLAIGALLLLAGAVFAYQQFGPSVIAKDKYQAVFLTNGQVYFGKLSRTSGSYYKLSDVFYLQTTAQADEEESNNPQQGGATNPDVQLIKLGNEVHGPEDSMIIERSQVLFFENLKDDGKVVSSIKQYQEKK